MAAVRLKVGSRSSWTTASTSASLAGITLVGKLRWQAAAAHAEHEGCAHHEKNRHGKRWWQRSRR